MLATNAFTGFHALFAYEPNWLLHVGISSFESESIAKSEFDTWADGAEGGFSGQCIPEIMHGTVIRDGYSCVHWEPLFPAGIGIIGCKYVTMVEVYRNSVISVRMLYNELPFYIPDDLDCSNTINLFKTYVGKAKELIDEKCASLGLIDENTVVYDLQENTVKLKLSGIGRETLDIIWDDPSLALDFDLTAILKRPDGTEIWKKTTKEGSWDLTGRTRIDDNSILFKVPLLTVLESSLGPSPYEFLAYKQLNPEKPPGTLQGPMILELRLTPLVMRGWLGELDIGLNLDTAAATFATFVFGEEIDLRNGTRLEMGKGNVAEWHDYFDVVITLAKIGGWCFGCELPFDVVDVAAEGINISSAAKKGKWYEVGEGIADILAAIFLPAIVETVFATPEAMSLYAHYSAPANLVREIEEGLKRMEYFPMSRFRASKNLPIWFNLWKENFALIDPSGIVHRVTNIPDNLHISWPYFYLRLVSPRDSKVIYSLQDANGQFSQWDSMWVYQPHQIVPPASAYQPIRVMHPVYNDFWLDPEARLSIWTHDHLKSNSTGELVLYGTSKQFGVLDLGWRNDTELTLKEPYACLISGKLHMKNLEGKIGVGVSYLKIKQGSMVNCQPRVYCSTSQSHNKIQSSSQPENSEYIVEIIPEAKKDFRVTALLGGVEITDANGVMIDNVAAGQSKDFQFPIYNKAIPWIPLLLLDD
jgi:hypothetical protein